MKKVSVYKYLALLFILLNVGLLAFLFFSKPKNRGANGPPPPPPHEILKLDDKQNEQFMKLIDEHRNLMQPFEKAQQAANANLFEGLMNKKDQTFIDSLKNLHSDIVEKKYKIALEHFDDIKSILRPEQYDTFEEFKNHVVQQGFRKPKQRKKGK